MKAIGYRKSLPIEAADALIDFETAKPEPKGRDVRVAVKAISANLVDYAAADLDHRLGIAVRPARRGARKERRPAHASDRRRRRWGRLDPDPACPPHHRTDSGGHRLARAIAKMVPRSRRRCR